ncbi:hypothetical protein KR222_002677, partial [Zaprionus bogoriensis]
EQQKAPGAGDAEDNIVNEQPIEISSDSSNAGDSCSGDEDSDAAVSVATSLSDSSESLEEHKLEDEFAAILAMPGKQYKQYMALCHTAFKLNVFDKIEIAIREFESNATIPPHIWLRYLKTLKAVTQTPTERATFESKCSLALGSYYDEQLAEFVFRSLLEQPLAEQQQMWVNLLADYGLDRLDFIKKLRELLTAIEDKAQAALVEQTMSAQCVTWNCDESQLDEIEQLIEDFKLKLKNSSVYTSWLQENFIAKAKALSLDQSIKCTLGKFIFEGCLAKYPSDENVWLDYIGYMQTRCTWYADKQSMAEELEYHTLLHDGYLKSKPMELIERALQAKPSTRLNHKYLHLMEQQGYTLDAIDTQLNKLFERYDSNIEMSVELHLDYLAYRVRNTDVTSDEQVEDLRVAFRRTWDRLSEQYGELADTNYEVLQLWALVEYSHLSCPNSGATIWGEILSYAGNSAKSHLWIAYAQMEFQYNDGRKMRSVLKQALMARQAAAQQLTELYRRHERCFGDYATIAECQQQCATYFREIDDNHLVPLWPARASQQQQQQQQQPQGRRQATTASRRNITQPPPQPPASAPAKSKSVEPKASNFKYSPHLEANKIFIKGLYPQCQQEQLDEAFREFGNIKDIRLVYTLNNRFKGIAYIEYELPEQAQRAVMSGDGLEIGGQRISVAISNPPAKPTPNTSKAQGKASRTAVVGASLAAAAAAGGTAGASTAPKAGEKRRFMTPLVPTRLIMLEAKRRKKLELQPDANGSANGQEAAAKEQATVEEAGGDGTSAAAADTSAAAAAGTSVAASASKTNADFRKLFEK